MWPWRQVVLVAALGLILLASPVEARTQGFNVDLDIAVKDPMVGGGVPSSSFGAAADQPGSWNRSHFGPEPRILRDLQGSLTDVVMTAETTTGSFSGLGFFNPINTGDYALLLNDAARVAFVNQSGTLRYTLSNMEPGLYTVYTYAVRPQGEYVEVPITIP